jgi:hypothetical protein
MPQEEITRIVVLLLVGLVWLFFNLKAGVTWLKFLTLMLCLIFLGAASWLAIEEVFKL